MASFSGKAKAEICKIVPQKRCCALAQCFGVLLFCNTFSATGIRIITESREFAQSLPKLFKKAFNLTFDQQPDLDGAGKLSFQITDPVKLGIIMESYGFTVYDLGRDVAPETVVKAALEHSCKLVGLSALMTTTVPAMAETVKLLHETDPEIRVVVGGAVLNEEYAKMINADFYGADAMATVKIGEEFYKS